MYQKPAIISVALVISKYSIEFNFMPMITWLLSTTTLVCFYDDSYVCLCNNNDFLDILTTIYYTYFRFNVCTSELHLDAFYHNRDREKKALQIVMK